jgi:GT2 family glycosyltransferase
VEDDAADAAAPPRRPLQDDGAPSRGGDRVLAPGAAFDAAVVVLSWNTRAMTLAALRAVPAAAAPFRAQAICVDNASRDGTARAVREALPDVVVVENAENVGYARGNAAALPHARAPVLCFLNSDTEASPGSIAFALAYLRERPRVAVVAPRIVEPDGTPQRAGWGLPTPASLLHQHTPLGWTGLARARTDAVRRRGRADETGPTEAVSGACLLVRTDVYRALGGFDPGYPFYFEDVDLCRAARRAGHEVHVVADGPPVVHHGGASAALAGGATRLSLFQGALRYVRKDLSPRAARRFEWAFKTGVLVRSAADVLRALPVAARRALSGRPDRARRALRAASERLRFLERDAGRFLRHRP